MKSVPKPTLVAARQKVNNGLSKVIRRVMHEQQEWDELPFAVRLINWKSADEAVIGAKFPNDRFYKSQLSR